jgi:hypothetical protein
MGTVVSMGCWTVVVAGGALATVGGAVVVAEGTAAVGDGTDVFT